MTHWPLLHLQHGVVGPKMDQKTMEEQAPWLATAANQIIEVITVYIKAKLWEWLFWLPLALTTGQPIPETALTENLIVESARILWLPVLPFICRLISRMKTSPFDLRGSFGVLGNRLKWRLNTIFCRRRGQRKRRLHLREQFDIGFSAALGFLGISGDRPRERLILQGVGRYGARKKVILRGRP